ncbi:unnamed protein product, partial [Didymodactylos carnosus]
MDKLHQSITDGLIMKIDDDIDAINLDDGTILPTIAEHHDEDSQN